MIKRYYQDLKKFLRPHRVLVLLGPRRVGKTTLVSGFVKKAGLKYRFETGDNIRLRELMQSEDMARLNDFVHGYDLLVIDEAQRIKNVGLSLKILVDHHPNLKIIVTGSSSFELSGQVGEPLTGRKINLPLYPISQLELYQQMGAHDLKERLDDFLVFGSYPEIVMAKSSKEKARILQELLESYLLKGLLELDRIKNFQVILHLLRLIAYQVGAEVSFSELATKVGVDTKTVARYVDLLEKSFVLYSLRGFSQNLRNEVTRKPKLYFYDNGIRNAIIENFNTFANRDDKGALWENFIIMERLKKRQYKDIFANDFFWRTWQGHEVDLIEERQGKLYGFEIKLEKIRAKHKKVWLETYPKASFEIISRANYQQFVC